MNKFLDIFKKDIGLSLYTVFAVGLISFYIYSSAVGYKWFTTNDTAFAPGGPSGMTHK